MMNLDVVSDPPELLEAVNRVMAERESSEPLTEQSAADIDLVWRSAAVQSAFELRSRIQLSDAADHFLRKVREIGRPGYSATFEDVLRCRARTTGLIEQEIMVQNNVFVIIDVGGQRNERKKWIHCFEGVTAVLFVASLSGYDQMLFEDETANRMHEALILFDDIVNSRYFYNSSMILLLNKSDLFEEKLKRVPLTVCFPNYAGDNSFDDACTFITDRFFELNRTKGSAIYAHITCATDAANSRLVFAAISDIVIRKSLREAGLIS
jgi:GTPase SAR1 family protein